MPEAKKPDKRKILNDLSEKLGKAYLAELMAMKKHQDADQVRQGARTPSAEDLASIRAAGRVVMTKTRQRIEIENEMATLIGIEPKKRPARDILDQAPPEDEE